MRHALTRLLLLASPEEEQSYTAHAEEEDERARDSSRETDFRAL